jgi:prevent-host-death family protein
MSRSSVSELKSRLSHYLREVRRGGEVQILDRGTPIARLTGLESDPRATGDLRRRRLIENGVLRPGTGDASAVLQQAPLDLGTSILQALDEDRTDRV